MIRANRRSNRLGRPLRWEVIFGSSNRAGLLSCLLGGRSAGRWAPAGGVFSGRVPGPTWTSSGSGNCYGCRSLWAKNKKPAGFPGGYRLSDTWTADSAVLLENQPAEKGPGGLWGPGPCFSATGILYRKRHKGAPSLPIGGRPYPSPSSRPGVIPDPQYPDLLPQMDVGKRISIPRPMGASLGPLG